MTKKAKAEKPRMDMGIYRRYGAFFVTSEGRLRPAILDPAKFFAKRDYHIKNSKEELETMLMDAQRGCEATYRQYAIDEPSQKFLMSPFLTEHGACDFYTFCGITALEYEGDDCV